MEIVFFLAELSNYKEQQNKRQKQFVPVTCLWEYPRTHTTVLPVLAKGLVNFHTVDFGENCVSVC
jgi:hypothetical protein